MFKSLRTRLLASYILIILVTLTVISIVLMVALRANPLDMVVNINLVRKIQQVDVGEKNLGIALSGPINIAEERLLTRLARQLSQRLLVIDANNKLYYDSASVYPRGTILQITPQPYSIELSSSNTLYPMIRGSLTDPNGSQWLYVGQAPDPVNPFSEQVLLAQQAPSPLNIGDILQYYGDAIFVPLLEAGLIGLAVAVVMSLLIVRSVSRPLQDVAKAVEAMGQGELEQPAPVRGPREVQIVAEAINRMSEQTRQAQEAQRDFLANVTHDLRTPLTSIQGFSQAIIDGVASNPSAAQRAAQIIYDEAGRLNRMVQELLDLARIEAGRLSMTRNSIHVDDILKAVGERLHLKAEEKGLMLQLDVPTLPPIAGDGDRLAQVFINLIDNAIKHTSQGTITVRAGVYAGGVLAQIRDTGEGIPAEDLPHIFERFYQVDKSRQREKREGAGLGLTITKEIVEAHGGRIWVESKEGIGTIFSTWFPLPSADATTSTRRRNGLFKIGPKEAEPTSALPSPTPQEPAALSDTK